MGAEETGYTLSPTNYSELGRLLNSARRTPIAYTQHRRRQSVFLPTAGGKIYQCVYGTRLIAGTVATEEEDKGYFEPVAICVELGTTGNDALPNLKNETVFKIQRHIEGGGFVNADATINRAIFEDQSQDQAILDFTSEDLGSEIGLTLLRTRFCQGYVGTGSAVVGNDTEALYAIGNQVWEAELLDSWVDGTTCVLAKITFNQASIDAGITDDEIFDTIAIRQPEQAAVFYPEGAKLLVEFRQQLMFSDDDAWDDTQAPDNPYWFEDEDENAFWPVFNSLCCAETIPVKNTGATTIPAYGLMRITGSTTAGLVTVGRPNTYGSQYNVLVNGPTAIDSTEVADSDYQGTAQGGDRPLIALYDSADGTPVYGEIWGPRDATNKLKKNTGGFFVLGVVDSANFLVLVVRVPFISFRGQSNASIASHAVGTASIYYRADSTTYTDTTVDTPASVVFNGTDRTVASGAWIECRWDTYFASGTFTEGWIIIGADC